MEGPLEGGGNLVDGECARLPLRLRYEGPGVGTQLRKLYQESFKDKHLSLHPIHILIAQGPLVGTPLCSLS